MPGLVVVDSIQTVALDGVDGRAGSVTQARAEWGGGGPPCIARTESLGRVGAKQPPHVAVPHPFPPAPPPQVRECATALVGVAKALGIAVLLVGQGARGGGPAGAPRACLRGGKAWRPPFCWPLPCPSPLGLSGPSGAAAATRQPAAHPLERPLPTVPRPRCPLPAPHRTAPQ
jgi:hypothetical protein